MSTSKLVISLQGGGVVREVYPDPYGQTYDCHLIHSQQPKTVQKLAFEALKEFVKTYPDYANMSFSAVTDFLDLHVAAGSKGRWKHVSWNSKSYPD